MYFHNQKTPNQLLHEKSPYLLQHAYNPVKWFPWGEEAFVKAKKEDKPIFLSIGYSTCHWCHVMAHESFEDPEIAALLNADYISVKVDREERPDIDAVYMSVCQAVTGQGGWPLTIIMTPEGKPFFAGTYLPPHTQFYTPGLDVLLQSVTEQWKNEREKLLETGNQIQTFLVENAKIGKSGKPERQLLSDAYEEYRKRFDKTYGGFGSAPKFPSPHNLLFLIRYAENHTSRDAMEMVERTLDQMYRGGMFDHIGGGFSRYSTDGAWLVPHFEKMLYDNTLLAYSYLEAYQKFRKPVYKYVAAQTLGYMLRELRDEKGGFYCGQDADSDGEEGKFYLFTKKELESLLGKENADTFCEQFGITEAGNFEGKNVLNLLQNDVWQEVSPQVESLREVVYDYRARRNQLHKDDKILTSWNGLAIAAFAKAYGVLEDDKYLTAAREGARFLAENMERDGRLLARYRNGDAGMSATLDDYAFYSYALIELYRAVFDASYLKKAVQLAEVMVEQFFDEAQGGFYLYGKDAEQLIVRPKEFYDGALPSGNSVAAHVLLQLFRLTGEVKWHRIFQKQISCLTGHAEEYPTGYGFALLVLQSALYPSRELLCACGKYTGTELDLIRRKATENTDLSVLVKTTENGKLLKEIAPFTADIPVPTDKNLFYMCAGGTCSTPTETL